MQESPGWMFLLPDHRLLEKAQDADEDEAAA